MFMLRFVSIRAIGRVSSSFGADITLMCFLSHRWYQAYPKASWT